MVLRNALAVGVQHPEIVLNLGDALVRRFTKPGGRLLLVPCQTLALRVHLPKIVLSVGVALFRKLF
ncbi:hypothetical protein D3C84_1262060 [compost metagenome]